MNRKMALTVSGYRDPRSLVQTEWLKDHLSDPTLRVFDCTTHLHPAAKAEDLPYRIESGRSHYQSGHIPGAGFLDLQGELSDHSAKQRFMLPPMAQLTAVLSHAGIGKGVRVVLYSAGSIMWATRVWWMLRAVGFVDAAVLDGGWDKWVQERRPITTEACAYPPALLAARPQPELFIAKNTVLAALKEKGTCLINALNEHYHRGDGPSRYGRPGRIPGSVNIPAASLLDPTTHTFVPLWEARERFAAVGVDWAERVIVYCGGGISATINLFLLHQLGYDNLSLYDGSLGEWAQDDSLPVEID